MFFNLKNCVALNNKKQIEILHEKNYKTNNMFENISIFVFTLGEMAEWSNAVVLKTIVPQGTGVRIPLSPH